MCLAVVSQVSEVWIFCKTLLTLTCAGSWLQLHLRHADNVTILLIFPAEAAFIIHELLFCISGKMIINPLKGIIEISQNSSPVTNTCCQISNQNYSPVASFYCVSRIQILISYFLLLFRCWTLSEDVIKNQARLIPSTNYVAIHHKVTHESTTMAFWTYIRNPHS